MDPCAVERAEIPTLSCERSKQTDSCDASISQICFFDFLPLETLLKIISFIITDDIISVGRVCKYWNEITYREQFERGMHQMEVLQDNYQAITEFTRAMKIDSANPTALFKRGVAHYKECEEDEAVRDIEKALELKPSPVDYHIMHAMLHQIKLQFQLAVEEASKAIKLDPESGTAFYLRGYNRFDLQDYVGSIADLSKCLELPYPYRGKVLNCRGWCYRITGEVNKALDDFTASSRSNVRYTKPFVNKAIVLSSNKDKQAFLDEERYLTEQINTQDGNLGAIYYTRAAIRQHWENFQGAIEDYRLAIEKNYHSPHKVHVSIGWCYEKLKQYDLAIKEYNMAIEIKPKYSIALEHRAGARCRLDAKAAEEDCKLAIQINPKNLSFAYRYLAAVLADVNTYPKAIEILDQGIKHNPLDTDMLLNRAGYYTCEGKYNAAIGDYDLCLRHRPDTHEAWKYRANVRFAIGDLHGAIGDYEKALSLEADDFVVLNNMGVCYMGLMNCSKATEYFNKALKIPEMITSPVDNNLLIIRHIETQNRLPKTFDPSILTDPVFEKSLEAKIKEVTKKSMKEVTKAPPAVEESLSVTQRILWKRRFQ